MVSFSALDQPPNTVLSVRCTERVIHASGSNPALKNEDTLPTVALFLGAKEHTPVDKANVRPTFLPA